MTNIDQFESIFRSATQAKFEVKEVHIERILVISDLSEEDANRFMERCKEFLSSLGIDIQPRWEVINGEQFSNVSELIKLEQEIDPDLICTCRNLHSHSADHPYSLGECVDVLAQTLKVPCLLMPRIDSENRDGRDKKNDENAIPEHLTTNRVMAITDHMSGQHELVNIAIRFVQNDGHLFLTHIEDEQTFERYIDAISKISEIDSDFARQAILDRLLTDPQEYIASCKEVIDASGMDIAVHSIVQMGHHLTDYKRLIEENNVDLLVLQTKDDDQLAMHGVAYPLAIELRHVPLLMI